MRHRTWRDMDRDDHSEARWFCSLGLGTRFGAANLWRSRVEEPGRALKSQSAQNDLFASSTPPLHPSFQHAVHASSNHVFFHRVDDAGRRRRGERASRSSRASTHPTHPSPACASPTIDASHPSSFTPHHHFRRPQSRPQRTRRSPPSTPPRPPASPRRPSKRLAHTFPRPPPRRTPELRAPERSPARDA